jgi:hypothetical protein
MSERVKIGSVESKKGLLFFITALVLISSGIWNGACQSDWKIPTQQSKRLYRDLLIASLD